ncbi:hypothetical protein V6N13_041451 [Hibiscus sabdariffa]|uniref:Uncharacterized protein n=1 Tax=Hibiscus sabdariffa TaxID=183260 RepID=A0ABR2RBA2_9ROSI
MALNTGSGKKQRVVIDVDIDETMVSPSMNQEVKARILPIKNLVPRVSLSKAIREHGEKGTEVAFAEVVVPITITLDPLKHTTVQVGNTMENGEKTLLKQRQNLDDGVGQTNPTLVRRLLRNKGVSRQSPYPQRKNQSARDDDATQKDQVLVSEWMKEFSRELAACQKSSPGKLMELNEMKTIEEDGIHWRDNSTFDRENSPQ